MMPTILRNMLLEVIFRIYFALRGVDFCTRVQAKIHLAGHCRMLPGQIVQKKSFRKEIGSMQNL